MLKKYRCGKCDRPINHRGNCLRCNLITKHKTGDLANIAVGEILKIETFDHKEIQLQIKSIFRSLGYFVELEKKIRAKRPGRIDLFAKKDNFSVGIEIDRSLIKWKSIDKLNTLKPNLAIFILRPKSINIEKNKQRLKLIRVKSLFINLSKSEIL